MFKNKLTRIYICIEAILLIALIVLQCIQISQGRYVDDKLSDIWTPIGISKVSLTATSLIVVLIHFIFKYKEGLSTLDLLVIYYSLTVTADIFFSFTNIIWLPHLLFLITYLLFIFIRKGKWFETLIPLGVGVIIFLVLWLALKMNPLMSLIDSCLGATLIFNCVMCWYKYSKTKDQFYLYFAIGVTLILISDLSIAVASKVLNPMVINHIISMINWPFYVSGNVCIVCNYVLNSNRE